MRQWLHRLCSEERGAVDDMVMWFFGLLLAGAVVAGAAQAVQVVRATDALQAAASVLAQGASGTGCLTKGAEAEAAQMLETAGVPPSQVAFLQSPDGQQPYGTVLSVGVDFAMPTVFGDLPLQAERGAVSEYVPGLHAADCALAASGAPYNGSAPQLNTVTTYGSINAPPAGACTPQVWVDDALPPGATGYADGGDAWTWESRIVHTGTLAQQSSDAPGEHQHYFVNGTPLTVPQTGLLSVWVWIPAGSVPQEIVLQWTTGDGAGGWNHRAYWGADDIVWGTGGTASRFPMGPVPAARGQWVDLALPASDVGLGGQSVDGMAFTLYGGSVYWDTAGVECLPATGANGLGGGWRVGLQASSTRPLPGQSITLTATANQDVGPTPFILTIVDVGTGQAVATCHAGSTCTASAGEPDPVQQIYRAEVAEAGGGDVQVQSSPVSVTWAWPPPEITAFTTSPAPAWEGQSIEVTVQTGNPVTAVSLSLPWDGASFSLTADGGSWSGSLTAPMQAGSYTLTATASGPGGQTAGTAILAVKAPQAPAVAWWGAPGTYTAGWGGSVAWSFTPPAADGYRGWSAAWDAPAAAGAQATAASGWLSTANLAAGSHDVVLTFFFAGGATAVASSPTVTVQAPPQWQVGLSSSATRADLGQVVTLMASSNVDVGPTPFYLEIYNLTTGTVVVSCGGGTVCGVQVSESGATIQTYVAQVAAYGGVDVQARSVAVTVTWAPQMQTICGESVAMAPGTGSSSCPTTLDGQHALVLHLSNFVTQPEYISYSLVALQDVDRAGMYGDYAVGYGTTWVWQQGSYLFSGTPAYTADAYVTCSGCAEGNLTISLVPSGNGFVAYYAEADVPDAQAATGEGMAVLTASPGMYDGDVLDLLLQNFYPKAYWGAWGTGELSGGVQLDRVQVGG